MKNKTKDILKIAITGHIDHGKSTIIGRLLLETRSLPKDKLSEIKKISKEFGEETQLAFLADQLKEERERNITIESTEIFIKSPKREYRIIDTPGHLEFIKNMLTGTSHADAAILVIDACEGIQEQTRRHAFLIKLLTLDNIFVLVNKMDLIHYDQKDFETIERDIDSFLEQLKLNKTAIIPISAKEAANISRPSSKMPWYKGPTLLQSLEAVEIPKAKAAQYSARFPVQDVYDIDGEQIAVGKIVAGKITRGQQIHIFPQQQCVTVNNILVYGKKKSTAFMNESIGLSLSPAQKIHRGDILCSDPESVELKQAFRVTIFWLASNPLKIQDLITFRCATQESKGTITKIEERLDPATLKIIEKNAQEIQQNEAGIIHIQLTQNFVTESSKLVPDLGRYVIEKNNALKGAGIILAE